MTHRPWRVFLPDPWVWERWMLEELEANGCELALGIPAYEPGARPLSPAEMGERLAQADGLIIHSRERVSAEALRQAKELRVIAKMGIGVEKIDLAAATDAGILVTNTPVAENYQGLAEGTVALLLALLKGLPAKERRLRAGGWRDPDTAGDLLEQHTLGIVGLGGDVGVGGEHLDRPATQHGAKLVDLPTLLGRSSVVSLHTAPRAGDPPLIGAAEIESMPPGSYLINTSRGGVLDEAALVDALERGHLAGAALDVFAVEPLTMDHPLRRLDNVIVTPHAIGTSRASQEAICRAAVECCLAALRGELPPHVVNPEAIPAWRARVSAAMMEGAR
jgi:D-3-phosphoglycerate dehydrogenase